MRQSFCLLVTGSRTWDDTAVIEHALAAILARHPEGVRSAVGLSVHRQVGRSRATS
jgi:hypothetical protein